MVTQNETDRMKDVCHVIREAEGLIHVRQDEQIETSFSSPWPSLAPKGVACLNCQLDSIWNC